MVREGCSADEDACHMRLYFDSSTGRKWKIWATKGGSIHIRLRLEIELDVFYDEVCHLLWFHSHLSPFDPVRLKNTRIFHTRKRSHMRL